MQKLTDAICSYLLHCIFEGTEGLHLYEGCVMSFCLIETLKELLKERGRDTAVE